MPESVCVIIAAWNGVDKTLDCLASIAAQDYLAVSVVLVNNGSTDDTVAQVSTRFPQVELIDLPENLGAVRGYNVGFRHALAAGYKLLFLLNNDTRLAPDCLSHLVAEAGSADDIGLVMPKIYYADEPDRIWSVGGWENRWNMEVVRPGANQLDRGQWAAAQDIDDAPFCAVLLKRSMMETVGLPDERFFFYYEDRDYCRRMQQAGYRLRLAPAATMWHLVSASSGGSDTPRERYWMARSSVIFFRKHTRRLRWLIVIPWRLGSALKTSGRLLRRGKAESFRAYWRGLRDGLAEEVNRA